MPTTTVVKYAPQPKKAAANKKKQHPILQRLDKLTMALPRGTFAAAGGIAGGVLGGPLGAKIGAGIGHGISFISGRGEYSVSTNSLLTSGGAVDAVPQFVEKNKHSVRISHREFIAKVAAPTTPAVFTNRVYTINAGDQTTFPWLSNVAKNYTQYRVHGAVAVYKSTFSDYAAAGSLGTVVLATNYNSADKPWTTAITMENSEFAVSTKPSLHMVHPLECSPNMGARDEPYYVRDASAVATGAVVDSRFYDLGILQLATEGLSCAAGTTLGELWITYDIELIRPIISPGAVGVGGYVSAVGTNTLDFGTSGTFTSAGDPLGSQNPAGAIPSNLAFAFIPTGSAYTVNVRFYRPGVYLIAAAGAGSTLSGAITNTGYSSGGATYVASAQNTAGSATNYTSYITFNVEAADGANGSYAGVTMTLGTAGTYTSTNVCVSAELGRINSRVGFS